MGFLREKAQEVNRVTMMNINCTNRYPFGKLFIEVKGIEDLYTQRDLEVEIEFNPYILKTKTYDCLRNTPVKFNQKFYVPIHNRFNILKIKLIRLSKEGIFSANKKPAQVTSYEYAIPFLRDDGGEKVLKIPIHTSELLKKSVLNKKDIQDAEKTYYLQISLKDFSDIRTRIYTYPNRNILEENQKKQYYRIKDIKQVAFRLRLLIMFINRLKMINHYVFYFQYPNLSYFICGFLILFTFFFEISNAPFYALFGAIMFLLLTRYYQGLSLIFNAVFFENIHPLIEKSNQQDIETLNRIRKENQSLESTVKNRKSIKSF
mmetsp:Transcript_30640/g.30136  ORF Transcript_30640/g.30136 Transcript_30640/m.30136 type:complete len:318 (+) Transcript_30640:895-1848(+)